MHIGIWDLDYAFVSSPSDHILPHYTPIGIRAPVRSAYSESQL